MYQAQHEKPVCSSHQSASYSNNSQSYENGVNQNSMTASNGANGLEDKRAKKRQRKQERTKKVTASKVTLDESTNQQPVPSFGAEERLQLKHSHSMQVLTTGVTGPTRPKESSLFSEE